MPVRQPPHPALALIAAQPRLFARQGVVVANWRTRRGRRVGPYYELSYREARRQRSIYLGRPGPLVDQVRQALAAVQGPWREREALRRARRSVSAALRVQKAELAARLQRIGLRLKGYEVRGRRGAGLSRRLYHPGLP